MIGPVHHVGIAVRNLDAAIARYRTLGLEPGPPEDVVSASVRVVFLESGGALVELITPLRGDTALGRFLDKRGEGLHHLAFRVDDIQAELARLEREGFELVDRSPRPGARGRTVAFLHPRSAHGALIELVQELS